MRLVYQPPQIPLGSVVRIDLEEVLDPVAVVVRRPLALPQNRADPQGGHAEPMEIAELAPRPLQGAAHPRRARLPPPGRVLVAADGTALVGRPEQRRRAGDHVAGDVTVPVLAPVGETVDEEEVQDLVGPGGRRRMERALQDPGPVQLPESKRHLSSCPPCVSAGSTGSLSSGRRQGCPPRPTEERPLTGKPAEPASRRRHDGAPRRRLTAPCASHVRAPSHVTAIPMSTAHSSIEYCNAGAPGGT